MSNFTATLPSSFNLRSVLDNVDVTKVPYVCLYDLVDRDVVFKQRYDCQWYINNIGELATRPDNYGLLGYVFVGRPQVAVSFFVDNETRRLFASSLCNYSSWDSGLVDSILNDAIKMKATLTFMNMKQDLESTFAELFNLPEVSLDESIVGFVREVTRSSEHSHRLSVGSTITVRGNRISMIKKRVANCSRRFQIFNERCDANVVAVIHNGYIVMINDKLRGLDDVSFVDDVFMIISSIVVSPDESSENLKLYRPDATEANILIRADPRVYYPGIARHCPVKPTPVKNFDASTTCSNETQVLYPKSSPVLYKAPPGYFIGLKINRITPPEDYPYTTFPVFPCCLKTKGYSLKSIYSMYLQSQDDTEFQIKIQHLLSRTSNPVLLDPECVGSLYTPLNKMSELKQYVRVRVTSWFEQLGCSFSDISEEEYQQCHKNFIKLGLRDDTTLREYLGYDLHDIRITYNLFETRLKANIVIYINRDKGFFQFRTTSSVEMKEKIYVIVYESRVKIGTSLCGFEVLVKQGKVGRR